MNENVLHNPTALVGNIFTGHFQETAGYRCYRPGGTADWLLIYTVGGGGLLRYTQRELRVGPGDAILYSPRAYHHYQTDPAMGRWNLLWAHFQPYAHWMDLLHWPRMWPGMMRLSVADPARRRHYADRLQRMHALAIGGHRKSQALAMNALEEILLQWDELHPDAQNNRLDERIGAAMDMIFAEISRPTPIATLARAARLSESRFAHLFKMQIGLSPREFIEQHRMGHARQMLMMSQHSVKQVAAAVGFASPFYFSLRFKRQTGVSPQAFRRRSQPLPKAVRRSRR